MLSVERYTTPYHTGRKYEKKVDIFYNIRVQEGTIVRARLVYGILNSRLLNVDGTIRFQTLLGVGAFLLPGQHCEKTRLRSIEQ